MDPILYAAETRRLQRMTAEEKLCMLDALHRTARSLMEAGVRMRHPEFTVDQIRDEVRRIFRRDRA